MTFKIWKHCQMKKEKEKPWHLQEGLLVQGIQLDLEVLEDPEEKKQWGNLRIYLIRYIFIRCSLFPQIKNNIKYSFFNIMAELLHYNKIVYGNLKAKWMTFHTIHYSKLHITSMVLAEEHCKYLEFILKMNRTWMYQEPCR